MIKSLSEKEIGVERPPVVAIIGHIDHGKSTLLDYIRKSTVAQSETGGITQHMSAYEVLHKNKAGVNKKITFIDTPGHEAFGEMRGRGASVADIIILVVAADDGTKAQTIEAIKAIKESKTPYLVAITKIDKPNANLEKTKQSLAEADVYLEGYGGHISFVPISSKSGEGIDELLEMILLTAELEDFKTNPGLPAEGVVIEASRDPKKGLAATLIIKDGTLRLGDFVVIGDVFSPVRIMEDFTGKDVREATAGSPVKIIGFSGEPKVGESFKTVFGKKEARALADSHKEYASNDAREIASKEMEIPIILKTDVAGSIDAISYEIKKLETDKVAFKMVYSATGNISENDIKIASGKPDTVVIGFNVGMEDTSKDLAERFGLKVETFDIIYKLVEWLGALAIERTPQSAVEEMRGKLKVLKTFSKTKNKQVIGCRLQEGSISAGDKFKITRREALIGNGKILGLQQNKMEIKKIDTEGAEIGVHTDSSTEIAPGDILEIVSVKFVK